MLEKSFTILLDRRSFIIIKYSIDCSFRGPVDCLKKIWRSYGIRGVYQGFGITCVREIPAFGIYFAAYEVMTRQSDPSVPLSTWTMLYAGGMAGVYSWAFTYPVDMVKSRLQIDGISGKQQYSGKVNPMWRYILFMNFHTENNWIYELA